MNAVRQDVVYALRTFVRTPGFTAMAVLTLAVGIGVNSAIFSVVDTVLLRPLPFPAAERVVELTWEGGGQLQRLSAIKFQHWKSRARSFEAMATWQPIPARVETGTRSRRHRRARSHARFPSGAGICAFTRPGLRASGRRAGRSGGRDHFLFVVDALRRRGRRDWPDRPVEWEIRQSLAFFRRSLRFRTKPNQWRSSFPRG